MHQWRHLRASMAQKDLDALVPRRPCINIDDGAGARSQIRYSLSASPFRPSSTTTSYKSQGDQRVRLLLLVISKLKMTGSSFHCAMDAEVVDWRWAGGDWEALEGGMDKGERGGTSIGHRGLH